MKMLYIFNPDTDYALASGSEFYTPSKKVVEMTRRMTLYPALWAERNSVILSVTDADAALAEAPKEVRDIIALKDIQVTDFRKVGRLTRNEEVEIMPWGWNRVLMRTLRRAGVPEAVIPAFDQDRSLEISSRERTVSMNRFLGERLPELSIPVPEKCGSVEEALDFMARNGEVYFKDPWSSSGRGVVYTEGMSEGKISQWLNGVIRRHGFVMAETAADRVRDFSSLWSIDREGPRFLGFSMFSTSPNGRYGYQIIPDGNGMRYMAERLRILKDTDLRNRILSAQEEWLRREPSVEGYLSIDMIEERDGNIRPGIEVNRRMTMGVAALLTARSLPEEQPLPFPFVRVGSEPFSL